MNYFRVLTPFSHKSGTFSQIQVNPVYFNRQDVKAAIHAPVNMQWSECSKSPVFVGSGDTSPMPAGDVLPRVMKHGVPVVVVAGLADYVILSEG